MLSWSGVCACGVGGWGDIHDVYPSLLPLVSSWPISACLPSSCVTVSTQGQRLPALPGFKYVLFTFLCTGPVAVISLSVTWVGCTATAAMWATIAGTALSIVAL
jgi:hypothetical protein